MRDIAACLVLGWLWVVAGGGVAEGAAVAGVVWVVQRIARVKDDC